MSDEFDTVEMEETPEVAPEEIESGEETFTPEGEEVEEEATEEEAPEEVEEA